MNKTDLPIFDNNDLVPLLPCSIPPKTLLIQDRLPLAEQEIQCQPVKYILNMLGRKAWSENIYARKSDLDRINKYRQLDGSYKHDFDDNEFLEWVTCLQENTAICDMENSCLGKGVFVPPGKTLPKGTFIISSGIIKLDPTQEELETKVHCSALQDLNHPNKIIIGLIDPANIGGILDLINHAPDKEELINFTFKKQSIKMDVATSNLRSKIKFYKGYSIMGLEAMMDIEGGRTGKQLLWSYASPDEYLSQDFFKSVNQTIFLFDNQSGHHGDILEATDYHLKEINIYIETNDLVLQKIATLTRWEIMESPPKSNPTLSSNDPWLLKNLLAIQASISFGFLQSCLKINEHADRVIITNPF